MFDARNVEFLQVCRLVLKGERPDRDLVEAIRSARANLHRLKGEFLSEAFGPQGKSSQMKPEIDAVLASIQAYGNGINAIEGYLSKKQREALAKGMEQVRQAIARIESASHRYQVAHLSLHGPTDMPGYNFLVNAVEEYTKQKISLSDLETFIRAAYRSVQKSYQSLSRHAYMKEVQKLKEAYQAHQDALDAIEEAVAQEKPLEDALLRFKKASELIRNRQAPAQIKILTEKPTLSSAANFMINVTREIISGNTHPGYFAQALKHLKMEYEYFMQRLKDNETTLTNTKLIEDGKAALELYSSALDGYKKFEETMETKHLPQASLRLQKAILRLYEVFKSLQST